jgi:hypothetical protein
MTPAPLMVSWLVSVLAGAEPAMVFQFPEPPFQVVLV